MVKAGGGVAGWLFDHIARPARVVLGGGTVGGPGFVGGGGMVEAGGVVGCCSSCSSEHGSSALSLLFASSAALILSR